MRWRRKCAHCARSCRAGFAKGPARDDQFGALIKTDIEKWGDIGNRLGVKLD